MRKCKTCKIEKELDQFPVHKKKKSDYISLHCKDCLNTKARKVWEEKNNKGQRPVYSGPAPTKLPPQPVDIYCADCCWYQMRRPANWDAATCYNVCWKREDE